MKIAIIGSNGRTGQAVAREAVRRGHVVTGLAKEPLSCVADVRYIPGSVLDAAAVNSAVTGQDAVICVIGTAPGEPEDVCSRGTTILLDAMSRASVTRLICQTGAIIGHPTRSLGALYRGLLQLTERTQAALLADRRAQERLVMQSAAVWTLIRPPRLTNGAQKGHYRVGERIFLGAFAKISRRDLAHLMVRLLEEKTLCERAVAVAY